MGPRGSDLLRLAWENLAAHRVRSLLAVLGVVFGSAAVVAMLAVGAGARREALALLGRLGLSNVYLVSRDYSQDQIREVRSQTAGLTAREVRQATGVLPGCRGAHPYATLTPEVLAAAGRTAEGVAVGAGRGFLDALELRPSTGRLYGRGTDEQRNVCVLGDAVARRLFPAADPVGRDLRVNEGVFRVVGVLDETTPLSFAGAFELSPAEVVFIPFGPFQALRRQPLAPEVDGAVLVFEAAAQTVGAGDPLRRMFQRFHGGVDDVRVVVPEAVLRERHRTRRVFTVVMTAIAAISLLVGGIGIANVMLASVLERFAEIGVRRAVGATRRDIARLFLAESTMLCVVGGLLGLVAGEGLAWLIGRVAGWSTAFNPAGLAVSLLLSLGVGLLAGVLPARRAAALDPIEALR